MTVKDCDDPIDQNAARLLETGKITEAEIKEMDKEIRAIVQEAADFAQESPEPHPDELYTDVVVEA